MIFYLDFHKHISSTAKTSGRNPEVMTFCAYSCNRRNTKMADRKGVWELSIDLSNCSLRYINQSCEEQCVTLPVSQFHITFQ